MSDRIRHGDYKKAIKEGYMFQKVAEDCLEQSEDSFLFDCINPLTVNASFACEVYLKAICLFESGMFFKGHFLSDQFSQLSPAAQKAIKADFESKLSYTSFEKALRLNNDAFDEWRYVFEDGSNRNGAVVDIYGLITLMRCLRHYVDAFGE